MLKIEDVLKGFKENHEHFVKAVETNKEVSKKLCKELKFNGFETLKLLENRKKV